ncbi:hypothetical protein SLE2022_405820, partial [Rubroshorea leprosula]
EIGGRHALLVGARLSPRAVERGPRRIRGAHRLAPRRLDVEARGAVVGLRLPDLGGHEAARQDRIWTVRPALATTGKPRSGVRPRSTSRP